MYVDPKAMFYRLEIRLASAKCIILSMCAQVVAISIKQKRS